MKVLRLSLFAAVMALFLPGCQKPFPQEGYWNGNLTRSDQQEIPFTMYLNLKAVPPSDFFLVSDEQTQIPEIRFHDDSLSLVFSEYGAVMRGMWWGGAWKGLYIRYRSDTTVVPFSARPVSSSGRPLTTPSSPPSGVRLVGSYQVYFQRESEIDSATTGRFWVKNDSTFGTFVAPDGDFGLLAGRQIGNKIQLSRFTGWQALALVMQQSNGQWRGEYLIRGEAPRPFTLEARPTLSKELPPSRRTAMKNPKQPFAFSGISVNADTIRYTDDRFKGKIVVIDIMGTWCHNCMDAAPLLEQISREFRDQGVEVVGLSFENSDDLELGKKNLDLYARRHGITFPLLICGSTDERFVRPQLHSQLENFFAYPTTLMTDRKGLVKAIHVGFKGPGTGEEYQIQVQEFYDIIKKLVKDSK